MKQKYGAIFFFCMLCYSSTASEELGEMAVFLAQGKVLA